MKIVYFGTPAFSASVLEYLLDHGVEVCAVVTQPDRPKGRSLQLQPSPVKALALQRIPHVPIYQPQKSSEPEFLEALSKICADLFVVVAFGQILPQKLLDIPPLGCINVHTSLLPKFRGAAPIQRAIMAGEKETGVCVQKMVRQLDAGDVIASRVTPISEEMTFSELEEKLIELSGPLLTDVIKKFEKGIPSATPQDPTQVSYAAKVEPQEGEIDWSKSADEIHNLIRAFAPKPGAWCWVLSNGVKKRIKVLKAKKSLDGIACGNGFIELLEVQPEGKKPMSAADWMRGQQNISFHI